LTCFKLCDDLKIAVPHDTFIYLSTGSKFSPWSKDYMNAPVAMSAAFQITRKYFLCLFRLLAAPDAKN
jgi:hypothetical protein